MANSVSINIAFPSGTTCAITVSHARMEERNGSLAVPKNPNPKVINNQSVALGGNGAAVNCGRNVGNEEALFREGENEIAEQAGMAGKTVASSAEGKGGGNADEKNDLPPFQKLPNRKLESSHLIGEAPPIPTKKLKLELNVIDRSPWMRNKPNAKKRHGRNFIARNSMAHNIYGIHQTWMPYEVGGYNAIAEQRNYLPPFQFQNPQNKQLEHVIQRHLTTRSGRGLLRRTLISSWMGDRFRFRFKYRGIGSKSEDKTWMPYEVGGYFRNPRKRRLEESCCEI